ncbi:hypothetical protein BMETH_2145_0 [methanotrophic bacterial endosymbiont of Bathymodiolus sp.]|nr:hypothetical protein BMETH_2145_0 [methanotrophic bacterial endosymbiont of Bathymodiolus sp.]
MRSSRLYLFMSSQPPMFTIFYLESLLSCQMLRIAIKFR